LLIRLGRREILEMKQGSKLGKLGLALLFIQY
jgi:hypothetical protein